MQRPHVLREGQPFVDDPVLVHPKPVNVPMLAAVAEAFGVKPEIREPIVVNTERVRLRWMKPDGRGGLVPK